MKIVFDTNPIFEDFTLSKPQLRILERYLSRSTDQLIIPQVVIEEVIRHFRRAYAKSLSSYRYAKRTLQYIGRDLNDLPEAEEVLQEYRAILLARLEELDAKILPIPDIEVNELLKRDLAERKPFSPSGKGFRDSLIWESIILDAKSSPDEIALISNDGAFTSGHKESNFSLHPHLADDLQTLGLDDISIKVYPDLNVFNENIVIRTLENFFQKGDPIEGSVAKGLDPENMLIRYQQYIHTAVYDNLLEALSIRSGSLGQAKFIRWPEDVEILEAYGLDKNKVQVVMRASMIMDAEIYTNQQGFDVILNLMNSRDVIVWLLENRWNVNRLEYELSARVKLFPTIGMIWDKDQDQQEGIDLVNLDLRR